MRSYGRKRVVIVEFKIKNHYEKTDRRHTGGWAVSSHCEARCVPSPSIFESYILDILQVNSPHPHPSPHPFIAPPPLGPVLRHKRVENKEKELWPEPSHDSEQTRSAISNIWIMT